jgi:hypothetical protein
MTDASQSIHQSAEQVRRAVVEAFEQAYDDAGQRGLCPAGRYEAAIEAARSLDLSAIRNTPTH